MSEVAETNPEPTQASAEVENAQEPSLDELLSSYDDKPAKEEPQPKTETPVNNELLNFVERQMVKERDQAIDEAAKALKGEVGADHLTDKWFKGQLYLAASTDDRIMNAFENRTKNPTHWDAVLKKMGQELKGEMVQTDKASTESWNAVEASVHSTSTSTPQPDREITEKDIKAMSDAEFLAFQRKHGFKR